MPAKVRILAIGDVVGAPGKGLLRERLAAYCRHASIDAVICNAENVDKGAGVTPLDADQLFAAGVNVITCGDHVWNKKDIIPYIEKHPALLRPLNYPAEQPGRGFSVIDVKGTKIGVAHIQGNVFMNTPAGNPFKAADQALEAILKETKVAVIDMHCEATSEKIAMGWYVDGRASFVFGTHTHIQTSDERVLPKGTAYITDVGMTGPYESVIGRRIDRVLTRMVTGMPAYFEVADGDVRLSGAVATIDTASGHADSVERVHLKDADLKALAR